MQLTANEELELRYMQALGFKWIARDANENVYAYDIKPYIKFIKLIGKNVYTNGDEGDYMRCEIGEYDFLKWEDEPLEIDKLLRENGKDVELVYPDIELL